jgi:hypothetical protein
LRAPQYGVSLLGCSNDCSFVDVVPNAVLARTGPTPVLVLWVFTLLQVYLN